MYCFGLSCMKYLTTLYLAKQDYYKKSVANKILVNRHQRKQENKYKKENLLYFYMFSNVLLQIHNYFL